MRPYTHKGLLGSVFGFGCVTQHPIAQVEYRSLVSLNQAGKGMLIPADGSRDPEPFLIQLYALPSLSIRNAGLNVAHACISRSFTASSSAVNGHVGLSLRFCY